MQAIAVNGSLIADDKRARRNLDELVDEVLDVVV